MKDRLVELGYATGWGLIRTLPASVTWPVFRAAADRAAAKKGAGAQRLARNLRRVVGPEVSEAELDLLVRDGLRSYARYWLQAFRLPAIPPAEVLSTFQMDNAQVIADAVEAGTGCVIALPHAGNWDYAGAWVCGHGWGLTTVAERLKPESMYQRFVAYRESLGMTIVPASGGDRAPIEVLVDALAKAHVVPLLADRDLSARGIEVDFFGARTRMPAGPALLALRTGAPLLAVSLWYEGDQPRGRVTGPLPVPGADVGSLDARVRVLTQTVADHLAAGIAEHPTDWHMLQRLWLDDQRLANQPGPSSQASGPPPSSGRQPSEPQPSSGRRPSEQKTN